MGNSTKPLTNTQVSQAKPKAKEYNLADGQGLFLRVKLSGTKLWLFNYTKPHTPQRTNISLGEYPAITLEKARKQRARFRAMLAEGNDPQEMRDQERKASETAHANSFESVTARWLTLKRGQIASSTAERAANALQLYILPVLGKTPIHKLNAPDTIAVLQRLADRGKLESVKKLCGWINQIMTFAVNTGIVFSNPLTAIVKAFPRPKTEHMPTIRPEKLGVLFEDLKKANATPIIKNLLLWQLHTMVRPGEAARTRWCDINLDECSWFVGKVKNGKLLTVYLSQEAIGILDTMRPLSGDHEYVFPSAKGSRKHAHSESVNALLKRNGYKRKLVSHGMRAISSTMLNETLKFDADVIEASLGHQNKDSVRAAYNHAEYIEPRREVAHSWSKYIEQAEIRKSNL